VGGVTLVDFGFARSPWLDESIRDDLVGTVRYLAPESAGMVAAPADGRSDLYALGVMLYESLAGTPPSPAERGHAAAAAPERPVPPLRDSGVQVPRAVDAVLERLLRKEPAERYQSAAALVADLEQLLAAVRRGEREPALVGRALRPAAHARPTPRWSAARPSWTRSAGLVREVAAGGSGIIVLAGESGGGKSRLLDEATRVAGSLGRAGAPRRGRAADRQPAVRPDAGRGARPGAAASRGRRPPDALGRGARRDRPDRRARAACAGRVPRPAAAARTGRSSSGSSAASTPC
jgi:hypothetical protein